MPHDATLRELYGALVPLGVTSETEQAPIVCPGRDLRVNAGDHVTLFGTPAELDAVGLASRLAAGRQRRSLGARLVGSARRFPGALMSDSDFSFATQPVWLEIFGVCLILAGTSMLVSSAKIVVTSVTTPTSPVLTRSC